MKIKFLTLVILMISTLTFAQKREIKNAEKALENNKISQAKDLLQQVESEIPSQRDKIKAQYYMAKGKLYRILSNQNATLESLNTAYDSFKKAIKFGSEKDGKKGLEETINITVNSAVADRDAEDFKSAYKKLYMAYREDPSDTIYLFSAANNAFNARDDQKAIELYKKLKDIGYQGNHLQYIATDKSSGEIRVFANKDERDLFVKSGEYENPEVRRAESRKGDIIKQLAFLYMRNDQKDKALEAILEAKKSNPNDLQMMKSEAMIYQKMGEKEKYTKLLKKLVRQDPDNAALYYNILGDGLLQDGKSEDAKNYYEKAIEADPKMSDAYNGVANIILKEQEDIVKEMNSLGMSKEDSKKYDELEKQRNKLLKKAMPYMENALKYDPENVDMMRTLYQLNIQLRNKEEAQKYKEMMEKNSEAQ